MNKESNKKKSTFYEKINVMRIIMYDFGLDEVTEEEG